MSASLRREREKIYKNANGENVYRYLRIQERERGICAIGDRSLLHRERERERERERLHLLSTKNEQSKWY